LKKINNFNEFELSFQKVVLKHQYNLTTDDEILELAKNEMKRVFSDKAEGIFNYLGETKMQQLFGMDNAFQVDNFTKFQTLLNNNAIFRENALKFIKIE
jgi:hypothetical protein